MTDENIVALKWLIASLESRIVDLMAGKLDESLEDLAKYPIPVQYRSLCQELKCTIPSLPSLPENKGTSIIPALLKDATVNEACSESEPTELLAHTTTGNNQNLKKIGSPDNLSKATFPPIVIEPVAVGKASPTTEITVGRKRKSSLGENDDDKKLLNAKSAEQNNLSRNSPVVGNENKLSDMNVEAAAKVPATNKSVTDKIITGSTSTPTTLMSPGRASTRSSRGSVVHVDEDSITAPNSAGIEITTAITSSGGKNITKGEFYCHDAILLLN